MLRAAKAAGMAVTKTSIMLGCGEHPEEVLGAMQELRDNGESCVHSMTLFHEQINPLMHALHLC